MRRRPRPLPQTVVMSSLKNLPHTVGANERNAAELSGIGRCPKLDTILPVRLLEEPKDRLVER